MAIRIATTSAFSPQSVRSAAALRRHQPTLPTDADLELPTPPNTANSIKLPGTVVRDEEVADSGPASRLVYRKVPFLVIQLRAFLLFHPPEAANEPLPAR